MSDTDIILYVGKQTASGDYDSSGNNWDLITEYEAYAYVGTETATMQPFKVISLDINQTVDFSAGDKMGMYIRYFVSSTGGIAFQYDQSDDSLSYEGAAGNVYFKPRITLVGYYR